MIDFKNNPYYSIFSKQKANQFNIGNSTYRQRISKLAKLQKAIESTYRPQIIKALYNDLGKPEVESEMTEIYQIIKDIKFAKKHLHSWMRPKRAATPLSLLGTSSKIKYEPKGVCLIISPWNFPFNLTFGPLVSAIAAGNTAVIKPSEMTPQSSALMKVIVDSIFDDNEVALVEGEVQTATALLQLPFNHIFFTGSPAIGKIVMNAASNHLASVTLELGGKSPTLVDSTANINSTAKKIVWGKFMNCGQTCIAPDYVLIDASLKTEFINACKNWIAHFFTKQPKLSESYGRIVNEKHFNRLIQHLDNADKGKATLHTAIETDKDLKYIAPLLISDLSADASLLQDEIFGPILPIMTYTNLQEAIDFVNSKERPLALYIFSNSSQNIKKIVKHTRVGGTCINTNVIHYSNPNLPFGGINNSGIGKSHGYYGFKAFSNERAIVKQHTYSVAELLFPPYTNIKKRLAKLTVKWF